MIIIVQNINYNNFLWLTFRTEYIQDIAIPIILSNINGEIMSYAAANHQGAIIMFWLLLVELSRHPPK